MIKIVTAQEMQEKDQFAIEKIGIPGVVLMENAGRSVFNVIMEVLAEVQDPLVYIFCGKGNNGGDGFVIARHLWNKGVYVRVFCIVPPEELSGDAGTNYGILRNIQIPIEHISSIADLKDLEHEPPDLLVDALLGTGIQGAVKGFTADVIEFINHNIETTVVAVDLPSGLDANSAEVAGSAVRADITVTMALPKRCLALYRAKNFVGQLFIADIGIPPFVLSDGDLKVDMLEAEDVVLPFRFADSHKYECGKVGVLAGSKGYTGAATLTAQGALKMGAGLVVLAVPESVNGVMEQKLTEVITRPLPETPEQTIGSESLAGIRELVNWCDVLAIGPGLGRSARAREAIIEVLKMCDKPMVIDADALYALSQHPEVLSEHGKRDWVLTPHLGEFMRFLPEADKRAVYNFRIERSQEFAAKYGVTLLLKGSPAIVALPDGQVFLNPTGNPGLASGGTGDVLTGFVAALIAQGFDPDEAAYTANFLHGYTADYILERETPQALLASDLISNLGPAMNQFSKEQTT